MSERPKSDDPVHEDTPKDLPKPAPDGVPDPDESRSDGGESGAGGLPIETR